MRLVGEVSSRRTKRLQGAVFLEKDGNNFSTPWRKHTNVGPLLIPTKDHECRVALGYGCHKPTQED